MSAFILCIHSFSQMTPPHTAVPVASDARPADVKSIEAIVAALYDVISGPPGPRDWARLQSLCIPEVRFISNTTDEKGAVVRRVMDIQAFQQAASDVFKTQSFYERGIHNRIDRFGNMAQVFSTYESSREKNGAPFERGINSMQFVYDGHRWWCVTILWDKERPGNPIPQKYLE